MITLLPCQPPAHAPARAKRCCRQPRGHLPRTTVDLSAPQGPGLSCACCPGVRSLGSYMEGRKDQAVERIRGRQGCRQQHARGCGMLGLGRGWWHTSGKPLCELVRPPIYPEGTLCARPSTPGHTVRTLWSLQPPHGRTRPCRTLAASPPPARCGHGGAARRRVDSQGNYAPAVHPSGSPVAS